MSETQAKIRAKGLDSTGVTQEIAAQMHAHKGKRYMAIVELKVEERHERADGTKRVDLVLEQVEPALDDTLAEHLREVTRTLYANRQETAEQAAIDDSLTPSLSDAINAGAQHAAHPFLPTDAADETGTCEVCGLADVAAPHRAYTLQQQGNPFEIDHPDDDPDDQDDEADDEPAYDDEGAHA